MISNVAGSILKKNMRNKLWWIKLGMALIISNIFFFLLFSGNKSATTTYGPPAGWVELQIKADLLTPFQLGKKVLLVSQLHRVQMEGVLQEAPKDPEGRFTILVKETEAPTLFKYEFWEILPFMRTLTFAPKISGEQHEIRY